MSKIAKAFENGKAFIPFLTVGDPSGDKTVEFVLEMERAGADLVELGIPFSDPTAEGVVIQEANIRALGAGMRMAGVFEVVRKIREKSQIPLVFLTYLNPVFNYGYEAFFAKCQELGVDGMICPDLPYEEKGEVVDIAKKYDVDIIALIAPTDVPCAIGFGISTSEQAKEMADLADGAIVGSAIVKIIAKYGENAAPYVYEYVKSMKDAL